LAGILDGIEQDHPGFAAVRPRCSYLVDEVAVHGQDVQVAGGSRVDVLPPFAGG
jgi:molybdopterin converting factor small subunit